MGQSNIHPTALVERGAELGTGVQVGPYCIVGPKARLHDNVCLDSHVVVAGRSEIGSNTRVWPFVTIGSTPQDLKYKGEDTQVIIGKNNRLREYVNISLGTEGGGEVTRIGDDNLLMVYTHVAHDCQVGSRCIFANSAQLAGHVEIADNVVIGGMSAVHQFCKVGRLVMVAGGSMLTQDVPPFCLVHGNRAKPNGLNVVGLRRAGIKGADLSAIKLMYRATYQEDLTLDDAKVKILREVEDTAVRSNFLEFLDASERGLCR